MRQLSLVDMHCDTAYEMYMRNESFLSNSLSVSLDKADIYKEYIQVLAVWSDKKLDNDDAYRRFWDIYNHLNNDIKTSEYTALYKGLPINTPSKLVLGIEDARILNNDRSRLKALYGAGVRILTLLWSGISCIGGAYDTNVALTDFGCDVVLDCIEFGIIPDISHASLKSADKVFELCFDKDYPVIASHSNSYSVFAHPRNLSDRQFLQIKKLRGVVGINLCEEHLEIPSKFSPFVSILRHIEHYLSLDGEDTVCFGCDFDGAKTPEALPDIASLHFLANEMSKLNYNDLLIEKIFYLNAKNFILKNIINVT